METFLAIVQYVASPLTRATGMVAGLLADWGHRVPTAQDFMSAAFAVSTGFVGFCCVYWACWIHARFSNFRLAVLRDQSRAAATSRFRDMLLEHSHQAIVILRNGNREPQYFADANALLQTCRSGKDGALLAEALDVLVECGSSFELSIQSGDKRTVAIRGLIIGDRAVLYLREEGHAEETQNFREILDALPMPVWLRGGNIALEWANGAFLKAVAAESLEDALASNASLDRSERDLAAAAHAGRAPRTETRSAIVAGERRAYAMNLLPLTNARVAGVAVDVTEAAAVEANLNIALETQIDMMERLSSAMAIFDTDQRLIGYNRAYRKLWGLSEIWLDARPSQGEILDRLRESRKLPEQHNFSDWKQSQLQPLAANASSIEQFWHLSGGRSLRILTQPHLQGGVFIVFEDISERLRLEASLNLLTQVQRATLDTIDEGMAIFGTEGRLVLHNALFAQMWLLNESELVGHPHLMDIAKLCTARIGHDGIWGIVSCGVNSEQPERFGEWGKALRADGRSLSFSLSRLPNGSTVVTFTDITDLERFEGLQAEASHAAA